MGARLIMVTIGACALALPACHKQQSQAQQNQDIAIDDGMSNGQLPANADIETLPPDESSTTPSNQLVNGTDNPEVNDLGQSNSH
jgi:ABC-type uncharacterized transport system auxiliary subunit